MTQPRIIPRLEGLETGERPVHMRARQCVFTRTERGCCWAWDARIKKRLVEIKALPQAGRWLTRMTNPSFITPQ